MRTVAASLPWIKRVGLDVDAAMPALIVALGYYLAVRFGAAFKLYPYAVSVLWPANALLLSALLLIAPRRWWTVLVAVLPAHLLAQYQNGVPTIMALGWFVSNCSEALIGAGLVRLAIPWPQRLRFDSFQSAGAILMLAGIAAPLLSSFLDAAFVRSVGWGQGGYLELVQLRFFSHVLAELTIVPLVLTLSATRLDQLHKAPPERYAEAIAVLAGVILT